MDEHITSRENAKIKYACRLCTSAAFTAAGPPSWPRRLRSCAGG